MGKEKGKEIDIEKMTIQEMSKLIKDNKILSPDGNALSDVKKFNQMFETDLDFIAEGAGSTVYLRPELHKPFLLTLKM